MVVKRRGWLNESDARRQEKQSRIRARTKMFVRLILFVVIVGAAVVALRATWRGLASTPELALRSVRVTMNPAKPASPLLTPEYFRQASGLSEGQSLLGLDLVEVKDRLMKLNWVKAVQVRRVLPGEVRIAVDLYEPRAILNLKKLYYVDKGGKVFREVAAGESRDYPFFTGFAAKDFQEDSEFVQRGLVVALSFMNFVEQHENSIFTVSDISEIHLEPRLREAWDLSVTLTGEGTEIRLGSLGFGEGPFIYGDRLKRLAALREMFGSEVRGAAVVDLRLKDRVVVTPKAPKIGAFLSNRGIEVL